MNKNILYLGENSYPAVCHKISEKFKNTDCDTISGNSLVSEFFVKLNESVTPLLDLKDFNTNAEKVAPNDTKLMDIIAFARKEVKNGDLNCLVNLAKEEHLQNMSRTGMPGVDRIIKDTEDLYNAPATVIEQGIKNGLFDNLESKLLMEIKTILSDEPLSKNKIIQPMDSSNITNINVTPQDLNESHNEAQFVGNLVMYSPIGVKVEDIPNNRILMLTENDVLTFDNASKTFYNLNESETQNLNIPDSHIRLMTSISTLSYNPETEGFSLNEAWDFGLTLTKEGNVVLDKNGNNINIQKSDVSSFLMESINKYSEDYQITGKTFPKALYTKDADNFIMLMENHSKLVKLDSLKTIRNLNESNNYVIVDTRKDLVPVIISSTNGGKLFENYVDLANECSVILNENVGQFFATKINNEYNFNLKKNEKITLLMESQKELNGVILDVRNLKAIAEENSPAFEKLHENESELTIKLNENIEELNFYRNKANIYTAPNFVSLNESITIHVGKKTKFDATETSRPKDKVRNFDINDGKDKFTYSIDTNKKTIRAYDDSDDTIDVDENIVSGLSQEFFDEQIDVEEFQLL